MIHVAGVNRASDDELVDGNVGLARDVADALGRHDRDAGRLRQLDPGRQRHRRTPRARSRPPTLLHAAAEQTGGRFVDVHLPNLFGEHGRPGYNSFVATFVDRGHRR